VSLLGYEKHPTISGSRMEMWTTVHSFVARGKGVSTLEWQTIWGKGGAYPRKFDFSESLCKTSSNWIGCLLYLNHPVVK